MAVADMFAVYQFLPLFQDMLHAVTCASRRNQPRHCQGRQKQNKTRNVTGALVFFTVNVHVWIWSTLRSITVVVAEGDYVVTMSGTVHGFKDTAPVEPRALPIVGTHVEEVKVSAAHGSPGSSMEDLKDARLRVRSGFWPNICHPELALSA